MKKTLALFMLAALLLGLPLGYKLLRPASTPTKGYYLSPQNQRAAFQCGEDWVIVTYWDE